MRVLMIGNLNRRYLADRYYRFDHRIHNGLVRAGHAVYFFCDRDEAHDGMWRPKSMRGPRVLKKLLGVQDNFQPDMVLVTHTNIVTADMLQQMRDRQPGLRIGQFSVDALYSESNVRNLRKRQVACDASFVNTNGPALAELTGQSSPFYFTPNLTDSCIDQGRAFASDDLPYDLSCFMAGSDNEPGDQAPRIGLARGVAEAIPGLRTQYRGFDGKPQIWGYEYIEKTGNSAMGLNLSRYSLNNNQSTPETRYMYSSSRVGHIMGNGSLAFSADDFGLQDLYREDEMVFFHDLPDLIEKVRFYKANSAERRRIAEKGWQRAQGDFNTARIMQYVVERTLGLPLSQPYGWPSDGGK